MVKGLVTPLDSAQTLRSGKVQASTAKVIVGFVYSALESH